jgi:hypothetical protein
LRVMHRGFGRTGIAQFAGAIGGAHSAVFHVRRMHTRRFVVHRRVVSAKPPAMFADRSAQSVRLPPNEAGDQSNLEALAQLKPDTRWPLSIVQPCASSAIWHGQPDQGAWPELPLHVGWQEPKWVRDVASLGGSKMVKQARMLCRAGTPLRHGLWFGRRNCWHCARNCAVIV